MPKCFHVVGTRLPRECDDIVGNVSGVYEIYPDGTSRSVSVYCNMDKTDKWTVRIRVLVSSIDPGK
jgi:hypothetical protein